jgi:hypothetical protein
MQALLFADDTTAYDSDDDLEILINRVNAEFRKITTFLEPTKWHCIPQKRKTFFFQKKKLK